MWFLPALLGAKEILLWNFSVDKLVYTKRESGLGAALLDHPEMQTVNNLEKNEALQSLSL